MNKMVSLLFLTCNLTMGAEITAQPDALGGGTVYLADREMRE